MNGELYPGEFEAMERQGRLDAVIPKQKMMTSEEAIAILISEIDEDPFMRTEYRERIHEALKMGIKALEQTRWIPVSERLPKEKETVIASVKYGVYPEARYTKEYGWEWAYESGSDYWVKLECDKVTAWMPLPKPYKAESEVRK